MTLLGPTLVEWRGREVILNGRYPKALLALLVLRRGSRPREVLATELWPEGGKRSSSRLRQALWMLRAAFARAGVDPSSVFGGRDETLGLLDAIRVELDVLRFEQLIRSSPPELDRAVALYRGDLGEELSLECLALERERLADLYEDALAQLAQVRLRRGDLDAARQLAARLLERDPLREEAHAVLIGAFGLDGSRSQILRQYRRLRDVLSRELGVEPLPETELAVETALTQATVRSGVSGTAGIAPITADPGLGR